MAIQFQCPACSQPLEVDDEWASKPVACPYCRKTVTAPEASSFVPPAGPVLATPLSLPVEQAGVATLESTAPQASGNALAVWAMALTALAVLAYFVSNVLVVAWLKDLVSPGASIEETQRAIMEEVQGGNMSGWLIACLVLMLAMLGFWIAGLVCGITALRKPARRGLAIGSLILSGCFLLLLCVGFAVGVGSGMGG
ncbi:MAG: hypothetical protein ACYSUI_17085 [Planctomycetota bacterium]|jgi:hypothetical protein